MKTEAFAMFDTPIGRCAVAWSALGLTGVQLPEADEALTRARMARRFAPCGEAEPPPAVRRAITDIVALLGGTPNQPVDLSHIELDMDGVPPFYQRVYAAARRVPPGSTVTYGELAQRMGEPRSAQAVGQALGHNSFAPVVPCHRVLAAGGRPGGFSANGGIETKLRMLLAERAQFDGPGLFDDAPRILPRTD